MHKHLNIILNYRLADRQTDMFGGQNNSSLFQGLKDQKHISCPYLQPADTHLQSLSRYKLTKTHQCVPYIYLYLHSYLRVKKGKERKTCMFRLFKFLQILNDA